MSESFTAKWYTRASRVRIVIAKFDGRWTLPGGPYPIPELVALVGGILSTLLLLPRTGQPLLTLLVGVAVTAMAVGVMRMMPYSPVRFSTRAHRVLRLYTGAVSTSGGYSSASTVTTSTVRPRIEILDGPDPGVRVGERTRTAPAHEQPSGLFDQTPSQAAALFS